MPIKCIYHPQESSTADGQASNRLERVYDSEPSSKRNQLNRRASVIIHPPTPAERSQLKNNKECNASFRFIAAQWNSLERTAVCPSGSEVVGSGVVLKCLTKQRQLYNNEKARSQQCEPSVRRKVLITTTNKILERWTRGDGLLLSGGLSKGIQKVHLTVETREKSVDDLIDRNLPWEPRINEFCNWPIRVKFLSATSCQTTHTSPSEVAPKLPFS